MRSLWFKLKREGTVRMLSGLLVPAGIRLLVAPELQILIDAAEREGLGWAAGGVVPGGNDLYLLVPFSYEEGPVPNWKCRVLSLEGGMSVEIGQGKKTAFARLDISLTDYRRLPAAPRKVERQLVHWLAWKLAAETLKKEGEDH